MRNQGSGEFHYVFDLTSGISIPSEFQVMTTYQTMDIDQHEVQAFLFGHLLTAIAVINPGIPPYPVWSHRARRRSVTQTAGLAVKHQQAATP